MKENKEKRTSVEWGKENTVWKSRRRGESWEEVGRKP